MPLSLLPKYRAESLTDLTPAFLRSRNIRLLLLDFDNTVVPYTTDTPTAEMAAWLEAMKASDIPICVVSNSRKDRVKVFCDQWGIPCVRRALKPLGRGIRQAMAQFGAVPEQTALAGDQIFTDTLGGNLCGLTTVLVMPINNHNFWLKARHVLEQPLIYLARKRSISYEKS
ncbi:MAG: YqeG family HAD IIIA-type phosphatase [Oscillospiraceae bacterium]|nr:YqeG family HAD IIIA-type phosphatase [Oscillospiraceae bacterium]